MTPDAPDSPDSTADDAVEAALRSRLREVDRLTPPAAPDFAAAAMRAAPVADDHEVVAPVVPLRRPAWPRWLLGAAAAILVVGGVGYGLGHIGGASSTAGSAGGGAEAAASQADSATTLTTTASGPRDGSADGGSNLAAALAAVMGERGASYGDVVTTTTVGTTKALHADAGTTAATAGPAMVTVYLTSLDDPVVALFTTSLPGGTSITFVRSSYSANACAATLARVNADLPTLARLGGGLSRPRCDTQGRVEVTAAGGLSSSQRVTLQTDYGDTVRVVDSAGNPVG